MEKVDQSALREAEEEMGISNLNKIKLPNGYGKSLVPKFAFKHKFEDDNSKAWIYTYFIPWHTQFQNMGINIKP